MTASEDISIVLNVYNHEGTVAEAIESVLNQKMPYSSVIYCQNDASTDNSKNIITKYAARYPDKVKVLTSTRNLGSGKKSMYFHRPDVRGRYWCLLDGDDFWIRNDKLEKQISFLDDNPDFVGCSCDTLMKNEIDGKESVISPDCETWNLLDCLLLKNKYSFYVHTSSLIWRNVFLKKGFFLPPAFKKEFASGDVMLSHMMLGQGGKVKNIFNVMSCYRVTGKGVWTSKDLKHQNELNESLAELIYRSIPRKYKLYFTLRKLCGRHSILQKLIPGPINS